MNELLLSVIIPIYAAENCLRFCADSILQQLPANAQLILVDDGSPDKSGYLCDKIAEEDSRVLVLHQKNSGASAARNAGIAVAQGRWVQFVDADDHLLPGLFDTVLPFLQKENLDLIVFGIQPATGSRLPLPHGCWPSPAHMPNPEKIIDDLLIHDGALVAPYGKFYRRSTLGDLRFDPNLKINEDYLFNTEYLAKCGPLCFVPQSFYFYDNSNEGSISHQLHGDVLDMELYTRPALEKLADALCLQPSQKSALLSSRKTYTYLCQYDILVGQKGSIPFAHRLSLMRRIFAQPSVYALLKDRYFHQDKSLFALPYKFCFWVRSPGLLALYCTIKNLFL